MAPSLAESTSTTFPLSTGSRLPRLPGATKQDIDKAIDAAHVAFATWSRPRGRTRPRAAGHCRCDGKNLELLARVETVDNGKAIPPKPERLTFPSPLITSAISQGVIRSDESTMSEHDEYTISINLQEPSVLWVRLFLELSIVNGRVENCSCPGGQLYGGGETSRTNTDQYYGMDGIDSDILPKGILNVVTGFGVEAGKPLATSPRVAKVAFTGETTTGRLIIQYASENLIPVIGARRKITKHLHAQYRGF